MHTHNSQTNTLTKTLAFYCLVQILFLLSAACVSTPALAASPTPKPSPTASSSAATTRTPAPPATASDSTELSTQDVRRRVEQYVENNKDKVQGVIDTQSGAIRALVGEIESVTSESLTVSHRGGKTRIAIESELDLVKDSTRIKVNDIAVGNWAIVIGAISEDDSESFLPKKIIILSKNPQPAEKIVTLGLGTEITAKTITVTDRSSSEKRTFNITKTTKIDDPDQTDATVEYLQDNRSYIVVGTKDSKGELTAVRIRSLTPLEKPASPTPRPRR